MTLLTTQSPPQTIAPPSTLGFQGAFFSPPQPPSPEADVPTSAPSLVGISHNSHSKLKPIEVTPSCPSARWIVGDCIEHGQTRWILVPCKKRTCPTCGPVGRYRIAQRLAHGVRTLWPAAWQVLTFSRDVTKPEAVRRLGRYVSWLRTLPGLANMQYAATYELTKKGRLHINLICAPWVRVDQAQLQDKWADIVWISWVKDDKAIANEAIKSYSPESLGGYLSKLEQAVPEDRRVSYSKGWPKMPDNPKAAHSINWTWVPIWDQDEVWSRMRKGFLTEIEPGHYRDVYLDEIIPPCDCFAVQLPMSIDGPIPPSLGPPAT